MIRKLVLVLISIALLLFLAKPAYAQDEFVVDVNVNYDVQETGITKVTHTITLENVFSNLYAKSYLLTLENIDPINPVSYESSQPLELIESKKDESTSLQVNFEDAIVGKGKTRTFTISFEENSFATRTGEVWEISIPRLSEDNSFRSYTVNLLVPSSFEKEAYISPDPLAITEKGNKTQYSFDKSSIQKSGITAGFGKFQVFSFSLSYHLENPLNKSASTEIAIPPDTAFQKVYYQSMNPEPDNVHVDEDGNWLATYILKPRERIDITALGSVQIFASPRDFPILSAEQLQSRLAESEYWQVNDPQIKDLATRLATPEAIYNFVTNNLSYSYDRVQPNVQRYGAKNALLNSSDAICMEFTDLFIALARAAGIPAREVNGFAYTENPEIQPLSLVADVLHSWPEYWDQERKAWIPVDPTWGSTTGGVDFFNKLDLRHFTFVTHGEDPNIPYPPGSYKLGPNPQKDVFVSFGQLLKERVSKPEITAEVKSGLPFTDSKISIVIHNPGPIALYNLEPSALFDGVYVDGTSVPVLPPYASFEFYSHIPFSFLGTKTPEKISIIAGDTKIDIPSNKTQVIIYNLLVLFIAFSVVIIFVVFRAKKITLEKVRAKLRSLCKLSWLRKKGSKQVQENQNDQSLLN
ncbi:MAG: transglutaminase-like domain-containing protein [Microgenomates group bacterium]